jgi:hypothetical protein
MPIGTPLLKSLTNYNLFLGWLGWVNWRTTNGHQPMFTKRGQQMDINPCPPGSPNGLNRKQQMGINPCSPNGR